MAEIGTTRVLSRRVAIGLCEEIHLTLLICHAALAAPRTWVVVDARVSLAMGHTPRARALGIAL
jgi:hypothetical protein